MCKFNDKFPNSSNFPQPLFRLLFGVILMISGAVISGKLNRELERVI